MKSHPEKAAAFKVSLQLVKLRQHYFQYTFVSNGGSVLPQETVEYNGVGCNFEEVHKEVINMDVWAMLEEVKAMVFEDA